MSLFIASVSATMSVDDLERLFDETFGSTVMVHFGTVKTVNGYRIKSANVEVLGNTPELRRFIAEVEQYGSATFEAEKGNYTVRIKNQTVSNRSSFVKIAPRIV
jgi:hypothetical protein